MEKKVLYFLLVIIFAISCKNNNRHIIKFNDNVVKNDSTYKWDGFSCGSNKRNIIYSLDSSFYVKITLSHSDEGEFNLPIDVSNIKAQLVYYPPKVGSNHYMNECADVYLYENNYLPDTLNCSKGNFTIKLIKYLSIQEIQYGLIIRDAYFLNRKKKLIKEIKFISTDKILYSNVMGG